MTAPSPDAPPASIYRVTLTETREFTYEVDGRNGSAAAIDRARETHAEIGSYDHGNITDLTTVNCVPVATPGQLLDARLTELAERHGSDVDIDAAVHRFIAGLDAALEERG